MLTRTRIAAVLVSLLLAGGLGVGVPAPASATSTILCTGYAGCTKQGMGNDGYASANGTMYWRMFSGHNCTNYAAYRMVKSGLPNTRPWSGDGNASNWGHAEKSLTNQVPMVGAVAWWDQNVPPAGSAGHVAYVEQVVSPTEIVVSQDSWGGDFSWARITKVGGRWPSGFVHFNDVPMTNTARPAVTGTAKVGSKLTASPGTWSQTGATIAYQWLANGVAIPNATLRTYTLQQPQQDTRVTVQVTASKMGYPTTSAVSKATATVLPGVISSLAAPTISGDAKVDSTLTATAGSWKPTPDALAYQWASDGTPIDGATASTLAVGPDLVGHALSVTVTASKAGYDDVSAASAATAPVVPGTFAVSAPPTVNGTPRLGQTMTFDPGTFAPSQADVAIQWLRAGHPVAGATGTTYPLTAADLGSRIAARMTITRPGYTPVTERTRSSFRVKSVSRLHVLADPGSGRVKLQIVVTAPKVSPVAGTVRIRSRGKLLAELTLRNGAATARLSDLPAGTRTFTIRYLGSDTATTAVLTRDVRIG